MKPWPKIYWRLASLDSNLGFGMCLPMHVFKYLSVQNQRPWESNILWHKLFQTCSSWLSKLTATIPQLDSRYFGTHYTTCFLFSSHPLWFLVFFLLVIEAERLSRVNRRVEILPWLGRKEAWNEYRVSKRWETANSTAKCSNKCNNSSGYQSRNYSWLGYQFGVSISLTGKSDPTDLCRMVMLQDQRFVGSISLVTLVIFLASTLAWIPVSTSPVNTKTWHLNDRCGNLGRAMLPF